MENETPLIFPIAEHKTLHVLMLQALESKCECLSCQGLIVMAKRIVDFNKKVNPKLAK